MKLSIALSCCGVRSGGPRRLSELLMVIGSMAELGLDSFYPSLSYNMSCLITKGEKQMNIYYENRRKKKVYLA